ncbi:MAG: acylphosphatase [Alphaproteobacteria bacterium]|nr:acylphosphatase [Alphaproteobacteria bacterium]
MNDTESPPDAVQVRIYGRVQGVWFRGWMVKVAQDLDLAGWVRNRSDGSVEALLVGRPADVETMIGRCRKGPPTARVDDIVLEKAGNAPLDEISAAGFRQLPTL